MPRRAGPSQEASAILARGLRHILAAMPPDCARELLEARRFLEQI